MFVFLNRVIQDLFYFAEYEFLTAVLVDTELWGNYFFWGVTHSAQTAQLSLGIKMRENLVFGRFVVCHACRLMPHRSCFKVQAFQAFPDPIAPTACVYTYN